MFVNEYLANAVIIYLRWKKGDKIKIIQSLEEMKEVKLEVTYIMFDIHQYQFYRH